MKSMRKTIVLLLFAVFWLGNSLLSAQETEQQQKGGLTAEFNGNLFVQDEILITPTFVKLRYFINDEIAVRLTTWFDFSSDQRVPESTLNFSYFAARPGVEYHFNPRAGVFSPYAGLEIILDHASHQFDTKLGVPVSGAWDINDIRNFENRGYFSFGFVALGGADFYVKNNFYLGSEFGLAYKHSSHAEVKYGSELFLGKSRTSTFGIDLSRVFRVGFLININ
jgi:outer membrane protein W